MRRFQRLIKATCPHREWTECVDRRRATSTGRSITVAPRCVWPIRLRQGTRKQARKLPEQQHRSVTNRYCCIHVNVCKTQYHQRKCVNSVVWFIWCSEAMEQERFGSLLSIILSTVSIQLDLWVWALLWSILLLRQKAPTLKQESALGRNGGKVVPLFLGVGLDCMDDVPIAGVLAKNNSSDYLRYFKHDEKSKFWLFFFFISQLEALISLEYLCYSALCS